MHICAHTHTHLTQCAGCCEVNFSCVSKCWRLIATLKWQKRKRMRKKKMKMKKKKRVYRHTNEPCTLAAVHGVTITVFGFVVSFVVLVVVVALLYCKQKATRNSYVRQWSLPPVSGNVWRCVRRCTQCSVTQSSISLVSTFSRFPLLCISSGSMNIHTTRCFHFCCQRCRCCCCLLPSDR